MAKRDKEFEARMQGDLISRSALLTKLNDTGVQIAFDLPVEEILGEDVDMDDFAMLVQDAIQAYRKMVIDSIQSQPTAYDVDAVVEQLKAEGKKMSEAQSSVPFGKHGPANHRYYKAISVKRAEMLVRKGRKE